MPSKKRFPDRSFDTGIAEQHAVTFAAGMATEGFKPFCAIYSTFLQRGYDQLVHDVALQNLPVRFAIDRAGLWAPMALPCRQFRPGLSELPAGHGGDGPVRRGRADEHGWRPRPPMTKAPARCVFPAAKEWACRFPNAGRSWPSARAASCGTVRRPRSLAWGTRLQPALAAAEMLAGGRPVRNCGRCPIRQAAGHRPDPPPGPGITSCWSPWKKAQQAVSAPRC